ncbi:Putative peptidase S8/S53 domain, peptidase S8, subtilisin, Ser-active [Colletotrichum destructivum]|uniref:Peptidase S8/S53 domain, peptidase S8, subtilisin, Ser-active n=1 Tax=Colletotrichum destructivum TaxID=34406 RepID=A0AAX4I1U2_9PEZI|nr:Putative peptidase S8/S53 domain, peptidase S8, subtilisin, Ser-active [Colletotrichum destructivum]
MTPIHFVTLFFTFVSLCHAQQLQQESAEYIIFAKRGTTKADADGFANALKALVGEAAEIDSILDLNGVPIMWRAQLKPDQLDKVKADRVIAGAVPNERIIPHDPTTPDGADDVDPDVEPFLGPAPVESTTVAKRANYKQEPTPRNRIIDLRILSTPPQAKSIAPNFYYEDPAGEGITIYHIDVGPFHLDHDEFATASGATRRTIDVSVNKKDSDEDADHGTCAASKIVGRTTGTAKRSNLVVIRIDLNGGGVISGFKAAAADIFDKKLQGKAVVSTSIGLTADEPDVVGWVRDEVKKLLLMDVPVVCASGNSGKAGEVVAVNTLPAILAKDLPLIVVGSANRRLEKSRFSQQGRLVTTWAVGDEVRCANFKNLAELKSNSGTSFAAPQVAGIAAYFMSHPTFSTRLRKGTVAADMRDLIRKSSFPRIREAGYPPIAWNLWGLREACSPKPAPPGRRSRMGAVESRALPACSLVP